MEDLFYFLHIERVSASSNVGGGRRGFRSAVSVLSPLAAGADRTTTVNHVKKGVVDLNLNLMSFSRASRPSNSSTASSLIYSSAGTSSFMSKEEKMLTFLISNSNQQRNART